MATTSTARHRRAKKTKIKYKALKGLEEGTPPKEVAALLDVPKNTPSTWKKKNKKKIFQTYESGVGAKRVKPKKYEALNKAVKK